MKVNAFKSVQKKRKKQRGQSTTEYILILLVIVMVAKQFKGTFQTIMGKATTQLGTDISEAMQP